MMRTESPSWQQSRDACPECMIARLLLVVFVLFVAGMAWATWDWLPTHHIGSWFRI